MTIWYVGTNGSDTNAGSRTQPFATVDAANAVVQPGDTVLFLAGTYRNGGFGALDANGQRDVWKDSDSALLRITNVHGTAEAPITYAAEPGAEVKLQYDGNGAIRVGNSSHIRIEGFDIEGPNGSITHAMALENQWSYRIQTGVDANGAPVFSYRERDPAATLSQSVDQEAAAYAPNYYDRPLMLNSNAISLPGGSHHIEIVGNSIHDSPGHAISGLGGNDYITVRDNNIYNNTWYSSNGNHAISFKGLDSIDASNATKIIVEGNQLSDNYNLLVSWSSLKTAPVTMVIDEGKTIHVQNDTSALNWDNGRILIANNVIVRSGNAGITVNEARGVDIINNTIVDAGYINQLIDQDGTVGSSFHQFFTAQGLEVGFRVSAGGIRLSGTDDVVVANNLISIADATLYAVDAADDVTAANIDFENNLYSGGAGLRLRADAAALSPGFASTADVGFVDPANGDYRLRGTSPAVDAGDTAVAQAAGVTTDNSGAVRATNAFDIGALEFSNLTTSTTINNDAHFDQSLVTTLFSMPSTAITVELTFSLPSTWDHNSVSVPILQYGGSSIGSSSFGVSVYSNEIDVYIAGRLFNTTIATSSFVGATHRLSVTWDSATGTARSYLDGVLVDTATVGAGRTISSGQTLTLGAGGAVETTPMLSFDDLRVFNAVRTDTEISGTASTTLIGTEAGLVGYWTADGTTLTSSIGGPNLNVAEQAIPFIDRGALALGVPVSGTITSAGTHDWYAIDLVAGQTYTFAMVGTGADLLTDPYMRLSAPGGTQVVTNDNDGAPGDNSWFTYTAATTGTHYLDAYGAGTSTGGYGVSVALGTSAVYDGAMGAGILQANSWTSPRGTAVTLSFGFQSVDPGERTNFEPFNAYMQGITREILSMYSEFAGVTFIDVNPTGYDETAQILFSAYNQSDGSGGHSHGVGGGDIHINYGLRTSIPIGSYAWSVLTHEIGHSLGLSHPAIYGDAPSASFTTDSNQYTHMSYFTAPATGATGYSYGDTLMLYDILAVQQTYGANMTTRTGDTVYGFNSNTGSRIYDFTQNSTPALAIWDAGGIDALDVSGFLQDQIVTLVSGNFSDVGGLRSNIVIAFGATVENAISGLGDDSLTGNGVANALRGGGGNDTLNGGDGDDALYGHGTGQTSPFAPMYGVDLNPGTTTNQYAGISGYGGISGAAGAVQFTIEMVVDISRLPSSEIDLFTYANSQTANAIGLGGWSNGNMYLVYRGTELDLGIPTSLITNGAHRISLVFDGRSATSQFVLYVDGTEVYRGTHVNQALSLAGGGSLIFGQEQDSVGGGFQASQILPGTIADIRVFNTLRSEQDILGNRYAPLADPANTTGLVNNWQGTAGTTTTLADVRGGGFPGLTLSNGPSTSRIGAWDNDTIVGGAGNDLVLGGDGDDFIDGGADNDNLWGEAGADWIVGREGQDVLVLAQGDDVADAGDGNDYAYAGDGSDLVNGGAGIDVLLGEAGNDTLNGGDDQDYIYGGAGANLMNGSAGDDVFISEGTGDIMDGGAGHNFYYVFGIGGAAITGGAEIDEFVGGTANSNDTFNGGAGLDYAYGGNGDDSLVGGADNDVLIGQNGNDTLVGGAGINLIWANDTGNDQVLVNVADGAQTQVVEFFQAGGTDDVVRLLGSSLASFAGYEALLANVGNAVGDNLLVNTGFGSQLYLNLGANQTAIWFQGISAYALTAADFQFV